jgi:hypothetical protein
MLLSIWLMMMCSGASVEGPRDKSYTYKNNRSYGNINNIAILPIEETSKFPMLSDMLE